MNVDHDWDTNDYPTVIKISKSEIEALNIRRVDFRGGWTQIPCFQPLRTFRLFRDKPLQTCKPGVRHVTGPGPISFPNDEIWKGRIMKSIRNFFAVIFGTMGALLLAPVITLFGLLMLGMAFGLSLIAAGVLTAWVRTHQAGETIDRVAEPVDEADTAERQPA